MDIRLVFGPYDVNYIKGDLVWGKDSFSFYTGTFKCECFFDEGEGEKVRELFEDSVSHAIASGATFMVFDLNKKEVKGNGHPLDEEEQL